LEAILFIATRGGLVESTISSIVAMVCYFFLRAWFGLRFFARRMAIRYR
jgi:hypothetical protein